MAKVSISYAGGLYDRMLPLFSGEVQPAGIDLNYIPMSGASGKRAIFDRMGGGLEFDASEMSSSEYITRVSLGDRTFVAIPVFPSRVFRHGMIIVNKRSGIRTPKDLEGKRVGVPLYTMTAAVWARGALQHQFGVDVDAIRWVQGALNKASGGTHGTPTAPPLLKTIALEDNASGKSLNRLLQDGEIDATLGTALPDSFRTDPDIVRLFPNYRAIERDWYLTSRIFPIMHLVVIRRDVYERHPFVATSLYVAMQESKRRQLALMHDLGSLPYMLPWMADDLDEIDEIFGGDPWPYGVEPNRPTLEALVQYLHEQALIAAPIPIEDLFVTTYDVL